jgi:hypothetical protein
VSKNLTPEILAEIRRVLERFGVQFIGPEVEPPKGKKIFNLDLTDTAQINQFLESRGADMYLSMHHRLVERHDLRSGGFARSKRMVTRRGAGASP